MSPCLFSSEKEVQVLACNCAHPSTSKQAQSMPVIVDHDHSEESISL